MQMRDLNKCNIVYNLKIFLSGGYLTAAADQAGILTYRRPSMR
jgi:hypothetical protein